MFLADVPVGPLPKLLPPYPPFPGSQTDKYDAVLAESEIHGGGTPNSIGNELVEIPYPQDFLAMALSGEPQ